MNPTSARPQIEGAGKPCTAGRCGAVRTYGRPDSPDRVIRVDRAAKSQILGDAGSPAKRQHGLKARGSSGSEGRADAPRWAAANGRPGRLPPPNPHRQPGNSIIQFREMTSDNATRAGPSRTPPTQCRRAQSDLAMQVSWSGTVRSYVGDVILGLVPENEGAVAADGVLVDALATACRPLTLARAADGRARVVRARMRFANRPVPPGAPRAAPVPGPVDGTICTRNDASYSSF